MEGVIGELGEEAGVRVAEETAVVADAGGPARGAEGSEVGGGVV